MRILFTGASSFTGFWFVKTLAAAGHEVVGALRGSVEKYEGVRRRRAEILPQTCRLVPNAPFGTEPFLQLIQNNGPWDLLCHHAAEMKDYRSPDFDAQRALAGNTLNLCAVLSALKQGGLKAVVVTGSVFEQDEGLGDEPLRAISPYGLSKGLAWQVFRYYCGAAEIPLGKFVIPNPFGPFEEPRFTAYLMTAWRDGRTATVKTPDYIRDNVHVDLLAAAYARFARRAGGGSRGILRMNPSGYVESQGAFAQRVANEVCARTGWRCGLELAPQSDFSEPLKRVNQEPAASLLPEWSETAAWDGFVKYYVDNPP